MFLSNRLSQQKKTYSLQTDFFFYKCNASREKFLLAERTTRNTWGERVS